MRFRDYASAQAITLGTSDANDVTVNGTPNELDHDERGGVRAVCPESCRK
jgi:hypothetical protein